MLVLCFGIGIGFNASKQRARNVNARYSRCQLEALRQCELSPQISDLISSNLGSSTRQIMGENWACCDSCKLRTSLSLNRDKAL